MKKITYKAFTLAELLISLAMIMVITFLLMNALNNDKAKQKEFLTRLDNAHQKINALVGAAIISSKSENEISWKTSVGTLKNLSCVDAAGNDVANKSECLKEVLTSVSGNAVSCENNIDECFELFDRTTSQLESIFGGVGYKPDEMTAIKLPGDVRVGLSYIDGECNTNIPIGKDSAGTMHYRKGCGFMLVDVNGNELPNTLSNNRENTLVDRFILVLSKNDVIKSKHVINAVAGCPTGTTYNTTTKKCEEPIPCPADEERNAAITAANDSDVLSENYPLGMDRTDCVTYVCRDGSAFDSDLKCPATCPTGQLRRGGLWKSEGGDLDNLWSTKQCCITIEDQQGLANMANDLSASYCLMDDIEFDRNGAGTDGDKGWTPIGSFKGSFYGNGHKINGLYINDVDLSNAGLFSSVSGSNKTIENLELSNLEINSKSAGGIVGNLSSSSTPMNNLAVQNGNIKVISGVGGVVNSSSSNISNVYYTGNITGESSGVYLYGSKYTGLIGSVSTASNGYFNGNLSVTLSGDVDVTYAAGCIGSNNGTINNFYSKGSVEQEGDDRVYIGGLLARNSSNSSVLNNSYSLASVSGKTSGWRLQIGGLIPTYSDGNINNSYSLATVFNTANAASQTYIGGIAGWFLGENAKLASLNNSYSGGTVSGTGNIGGVIGNMKNYDSTTTSSWAGPIEINNVYSTSIIDSTSTTAHSLIGSLSFLNMTLNNLFYSPELSGKTTAHNLTDTIDGITSKTSVQLRQVATYAGWDRNIWHLTEGFYPTHKASIMPPQPHRDCRNDINAHGGCFDVLNTENAWNFNYIWAWRLPTAGGGVQDPVLRYQCKPYRADGFDCCKPYGAAGDNLLPICPDLNGRDLNTNPATDPATCAETPYAGQCIDY